MIIIVDFGSQTTHLIARRIRELGAKAKIVSPGEILEQVQNNKPGGIILSGGPASVYEKNAPSIDRKIFSLGIPILGICYGFQLSSHLEGGKVIMGKKEYGPTTLQMANGRWQMANKLPKRFTVWMSHGDEVARLPKGFKTIGSSDGVPFAFVENKKKKIYGLQFHPEVEHTEFGLQILRNFISICHPEFISGSKHRDKKEMLKQVQHDTDKIIKNIREMVREKDCVIGAVSGGVDSTVAAALTAKAIGKRFIPIYVDNGLMREGTRNHVIKIFKQIGIKPVVVDAVGETLKKLKKITDSEKKKENNRQLLY